MPAALRRRRFADSAKIALHMGISARQAMPDNIITASGNGQTGQGGLLCNAHTMKKEWGEQVSEMARAEESDGRRTIRLFCVSLGVVVLGAVVAMFLLRRFFP